MKKTEASMHAEALAASAGGKFTCPRCGWTSFHPMDVVEGYCGHCHDWTRVLGSAA